MKKVSLIDLYFMDFNSHDFVIENCREPLDVFEDEIPKLFEEMSVIESCDLVEVLRLKKKRVYDLIFKFTDEVSENLFEEWFSQKQIMIDENGKPIIKLHKIKDYIIKNAIMEGQVFDKGSEA